jgi:Ca2+-binding EF-hand superfamily protein
MFRTVSMTLALIAGAAPLAAQGAPQSITKDKWLGNAETEFARVDTNKDGQMSRAEIEVFQKAAAVRMIAERSQAVFAKLDADHNGQLSAAEFAKINNTDPKVDISNVMSVDTNKDGKISLAEHKAATLQTFTSVDANKDGILTEAEVDAMARKK